MQNTNALRDLLKNAKNEISMAFNHHIQIISEFLTPKQVANRLQINYRKVISRQISWQRFSDIRRAV